MSDRRFEPDQIYDLPALPPDATHDELLEHQQREDQWRRTREPVATGSKFLKFITWADLVKAGIITVSDVVGNDDPDSPDDPPGDPNDPDSPDFVNEPRLVAYARDMYLPVTYACSALTVIENADTKPNLQVLLFDASTYESAQFALILPREWPGRALRYRVYWSHGSGASAYGVSWDLTAHSYEDDETLLTDWATGLIVTDTGGTANDMYITAESAPVTVNGNLAKPGDMMLFRITRRVEDAEDTLDVDARLHAVELLIGEVDVDFPPVVDPDVDPYWAYVSLLVQDGEPASGDLINRTAFADTATITSNADWTASPSLLGANMLSLETAHPAINYFASTGSDSEYGREAGVAFTIEFWVNLQSWTAYGAYFFSWWKGASNRIVEVTFTGLTPMLRIRNGDDASIETYEISGGEHFVQLNIEADGTYTLDWDGVEVYTGTNLYENDTGGEYQVQVGSWRPWGTTTGLGSTDVYVTPFRFTRGVSRPRGSVPTALFPTA